MSAPLSGPGVGLPPNQNLYPSELGNAPSDFPGNRQGLAGGQCVVLPAGDWYVSLGMYSVLQFYDTVSNSWIIGASGGWESGMMFVKSDGFNVRVANLTGCPVGAVVTQYGGGWVQSTTSIAVVGGGGSLWTPIVGGQLSFGSIVTGAGGAGYGVAPMVFIPPPPGPANNANGVGGIPAHGYCGISSGTISGFTFTHPGAGYPSNTLTLVAVPMPFDPNLSTGITAGTIVLTPTGSGSITGVICTNNGAPLAAFNPGLTLTPSGAGSNATITPVIMQSVVSFTATGAGSGMGATNLLVTTAGGNPSLGTVTNSPEFNHIAFKPRQMQALLAIAAVGSITTGTPGVIIDGGLFEGVPTANIVLGAQAGGPAAGGGSVVAPTITLVTGTNPDFVHIQAAP